MSSVPSVAWIALLCCIDHHARGVPTDETGNFIFSGRATTWLRRRFGFGRRNGACVVARHAHAKGRPSFWCHLRKCLVAKKLFMAKVCVRRLSDHYFVHAIREAIRKVSQQKQCPNEERIVRTVLQEFDWTKQQVSEQLHFAVEDGLISRVTTTSNHGKTKGIPQTAYRVYLKDSDENVSIVASLFMWALEEVQLACHSSPLFMWGNDGGFTAALRAF